MQCWLWFYKGKLYFLKGAIDPCHSNQTFECLFIVTLWKAPQQRGVVVGLFWRKQLCVMSTTSTKSKWHYSCGWLYIQRAAETDFLVAITTAAAAFKWRHERHELKRSIASTDCATTARLLLQECNDLNQCGCQNDKQIMLSVLFKDCVVLTDSEYF